MIWTRAGRSGFGALCENVWIASIFYSGWIPTTTYFQTLIRGPWSDVRFRTILLRN